MTIGEATMTAAEEAAWVARMRGRGLIVGTRDRRAGSPRAEVARQHPKPRRVPTAVQADAHSLAMGRRPKSKRDADIAEAVSRRAPKPPRESKVVPSVACNSCPELFWTLDGMRAHTVEAHGAHYHRWRLESPCGPWVRGECGCGAVKQFPASDGEWGIASSVGAAR